METKFHIMNTCHRGDVILTRPLIIWLKKDFEVTLECTAASAYLWEDLELPIFPGPWGENDNHESARCPPYAIAVNLWFGVYRDLTYAHGMTVACQANIFNRRMTELGLPWKMPIPSQPPPIDFAQVADIPVPRNAVLIENGPVGSGQSSFDLNSCLDQLAADFPQINFCCSSRPSVVCGNVLDFSSYNLIQLSQVADKCVALVTVGSGVNAACYTSKSMYKPRCIVGWTNRIPLPVWHTQVHMLANYGQIRQFLRDVFRRGNE